MIRGVDKKNLEEIELKLNNYKYINDNIIMRY